jgi:hypothetical protein
MSSRVQPTAAAAAIETRATADERWLLWFAISVFGLLGCFYAIAVSLT